MATQSFPSLAGVSNVKCHTSFQYSRNLCCSMMRLCLSNCVSRLLSTILVDLSARVTRNWSHSYKLVFQHYYIISWRWCSSLYKKKGSVVKVKPHLFPCHAEGPLSNRFPSISLYCFCTHIILVSYSNIYVQNKTDKEPHASTSRIQPPCTITTILFPIGTISLSIHDINVFFWHTTRLDKCGVPDAAKFQGGNIFHNFVCQKDQWCA